jgi:4-amino-4-deoxychorismate lyase
MSETLGCWVDGVPANSIPADDRGLHYGDGLFETLLVRKRQPRFLEAHLARLATGCARLAIPFDATMVRAQIAVAAGHAPPQAILKLLVTRGSAPRRGYAPSGNTPRCVALLYAAPPPPGPFGVELGIARLRLSHTPALAGLKHLNRLENVLAAAEIPEGAFDALQLDEDGGLVGGTMSNVFLVTRNALVTPRVDRCGIAGVMRAIVMRESVTLGLRCEERAVRLPDVEGADEVFITNARIGVVPVRRVGEHAFRMNTLTLRLRAQIEALDA